MPLVRSPPRETVKSEMEAGKREEKSSCFLHLLVAGFRLVASICFVWSYVFLLFLNDSRGQIGHRLKGYETSGRVLTFRAELTSGFS